MVTAFHAPAKLEEALGLIAKGAIPVAGATGLYSAKSRPEGELVDVTRIGLDAVRAHDGVIELGAAATLTHIADSELPGVEGRVLKAVAGTISSRPMRNMVTLGGNIAHVAYWADMPVALLALDAELEIARAGAPTSRVNVGAALKGKAPWDGGLITRILVRVRPGTWGHGYERVGRTVTDYALATACAVMRKDGSVARDVRLVVGALQPRPFRVPEAEAMLEGRTPDAQLLSQVEAKVRELVPVAPNFRASPDYRRSLAATLSRRALAAAWQSAKEA